jgi:hypothetical protein
LIAVTLADCNCVSSTTGKTRPKASSAWLVPVVKSSISTTAGYGPSSTEVCVPPTVKLPLPSPVTVPVEVPPPSPHRMVAL